MIIFLSSAGFIYPPHTMKEGASSKGHSKLQYIILFYLFPYHFFITLEQILQPLFIAFE